jgi:hypothetical protein
MAEFNPRNLANDMAYRYTRRRSEVKEPRELLHYKRLLNKARSNPEDHSMPICHKHIGQLASSIHKREISDTVIVLVPPGRDPQRTIQVGCFLCYRYPA